MKHLFFAAAPVLRQPGNNASLFSLLLQNWVWENGVNLEKILRVVMTNQIKVRCGFSEWSGRTNRGEYCCDPSHAPLDRAAVSASRLHNEHSPGSEIGDLNAEWTKSIVIRVFNGGSATVRWFSDGGSVFIKCHRASAFPASLRIWRGLMIRIGGQTSSHPL